MPNQEIERRVARRLLTEIDHEIVAVERMVLEGPPSAELEIELALMLRMRAVMLRVLAKAPAAGEDAA